MSQLFVLQYHYTSDYMEKRDACRAAHLSRIAQAVKEGRILAAGVLPKEPSALIVFRADSESEVLAFGRDDPYMTDGLIKSMDAEPWMVAVGVDALVAP